MYDVDNQIISVVITAYNVAPYISSCVGSVLVQTYQNIEVWIVDDGSTDGTSEICDRLACIDNRINVIHQKNSGPGAARNVGTLQARGRYITYVDGDDLLHPNCLRYLWKAIREDGTQIAVCKTQLIYEFKPVTFKDSSKVIKIKYLHEIEGLRALLYQNEFDTSAWGKLYLAHEIRQFPFPETGVYEDIIPTVKIFAQSKKTAVITTPLYGYLQRSESIMHKKNLQSLTDELTMSDLMYDWVSKNYSQVESAALHKKFSNYCQILRAIPTLEEKGETLRETVISFLKVSAGRVLKDKNARIKNRLGAALILLSPQLLEKIP